MKTVFILGKAFSSITDKGQNTASVEKDGTVTVQDPLTGQRTTCHSLTEGQQEEIRAARPYSTVKIAPAPSAQETVDDYDTAPERLEWMKEA